MEYHALLVKDGGFCSGYVKGKKVLIDIFIVTLNRAAGWR